MAASVISVFKSLHPHSAFAFTPCYKTACLFTSTCLYLPAQADVPNELRHLGRTVLYELPESRESGSSVCPIEQVESRTSVSGIACATHYANNLSQRRLLRHATEHVCYTYYYDSGSLFLQ